MNKNLVYILIAFILFPASYVPGQDFPMLHYTVEDGLPSNTIYSVYNDSRGFLWIATDKGIARYNGIKFETFTTANGLPDNEIFFFREDYYGRLWLATYNGELCYYKDDTFHTKENTPFLNLPYKTPLTQGILIEADSSINIAFFNKYQFININKNKAKIIDLYKTNDTDFINGMIYREKLPDGNYRIVSSQGIKIIDTNYKIVKRTSLNIDQHNDFFIRATSNQNNYYIYTHYLMYDSALHMLRSLDTNITRKHYIHNIYHNELGWLLSTDHGVFINDSLNILKQDNISYVFQDINKNYWIATLGDGLFILDNNFIESKRYANSYNGEIKYVFCDKSHLFFVTSNRKDSLYSLVDKNVEYIYGYSHPAPSEQRFSSAFFIDSCYNFYNANSKGIVMIKNLLSKPFQERKYYCDLPEKYVIRTAMLQDDHIYINAKLTLLDLNLAALGKIEQFNYNYVTDTNSLERIFDIAKYNDHIWFSDIRNVYKVTNGHAAKLSQFQNVAFKSFTFFGNYMVGYTHNNKLYIYNNIDKEPSVDSIANQNCIWEKFYPIDSVHMLLSTNNLYRLLTCYPNGQTEKFTIWPVENPFVPLQSEAVCSDGKNCYFFKDGSIISLDIESILKKPEPPKLFFTLLKAGKNTYPIQNEMQIPFRQSKNISVSFSTLSFNSKSVTYQFSALSNGDSDLWRDVTGDALNLYNLGYGAHTIKLRAKTISSDYSAPIVFSLYILRPFWATWWFIILCTAAFLAVLGLVIRARISYVLQKNKKAHESEVKFMKSEYKALNALMNPHFIFNTLNNVQSLVNDNNKLAANEYLRVFADLIRQNMHNVSKELIPLQKEMELVTNYLALEKLRFEDKLTYTVNTDENIDLSDIMVPPLLIQPLVENSIKHGILPQKDRQGTIHIGVYEHKGTLYIEVKDNGAGMSNLQNKTTVHESFGLENIKTRIQQLSMIQGKDISLSISEIKDDAGNIEGTIVTITMPISE